VNLNVYDYPRSNDSEANTSLARDERYRAGSWC
jgi:hypothetical protein